MSDILDKKIAAAMSGERVDIAGSLSEAEVRDSYAFQLEQLTRLTTALDILFPVRTRVGVASIDAAIRALEALRNARDIACDRWEEYANDSCDAASEIEIKELELAEIEGVRKVGP